MKHALFAGLVFNEQGQPAEVVYVGEEPSYVILMKTSGDTYRRARLTCRSCAGCANEVMDQQDLVTESAMAMLGRDDLFTKAMLDSSIRNLDRQMDQMIEMGLPEQARAWLGMMGFRIQVDIHGQLASIDMPSGPVDDED